MFNCLHYEKFWAAKSPWTLTGVFSRRVAVTFSKSSTKIYELRNWTDKLIFKINSKQTIATYDFYIIRLEARLQPNIGFTLRRFLAVFTRSAITPRLRQRWTDLDQIWSTLSRLWGLALTDLGCDPRSNDSWRARRNFLSGKRRMISPIFPAVQISRKLNTTRRSLSRWFWKFYREGSFFQKSKIFEKTNVLRIQAAKTPQWLQIAGNSLPK